MDFYNVQSEFHNLKLKNILVSPDRWFAEISLLSKSKTSLRAETVLPIFSPHGLTQEECWLVMEVKDYVRLRAAKDD